MFCFHFCQMLSLLYEGDIYSIVRDLFLDLCTCIMRHPFLKLYTCMKYCSLQINWSVTINQWQTSIYINQSQICVTVFVMWQSYSYVLQNPCISYSVISFLYKYSCCTLCSLKIMSDILYMLATFQAITWVKCAVDSGSFTYSRWHLKW